MIDNEMDLVGKLREIEPLSEEAYLWARTALTDEIAQGMRVMPSRRRRLLVARGAAGIGVAAAVAAVLVLTSTSPVVSTDHHNVATNSRSTQPLVRLADFVEANASPLPGDASLVLRTESYADGQQDTGADLYTDAGQYYYSETEAGLPAAIAGGENQGDGMFKREVGAAMEAAGGDVSNARVAMADAAISASPPATSPATSAARAAASAAIAKAKAKGIAVGPLTTAGIAAHLDNYIWENSLDALSAGGGNPQVRVGVLRILATLPEVTVTHTATNGEPSLTLTAIGSPVLPANYQEALTIGAETGAPLSFAGGDVGAVPSVTAMYQVSRVSVTDVEAGKF